MYLMFVPEIIKISYFVLSQRQEILHADVFWLPLELIRYRSLLIFQILAQFVFSETGQLKREFLENE